MSTGHLGKLLPVSYDSNLCHLVLARIQSVFRGSSGELPFPTFKVAS